MRLPLIGVGCAALSIVSPQTGDEDAVELLVHAHARGVRYFDVAPLYGGGRGEVLLGRALARMPAPVIVSTKVGYAGAIPYGGRQAPEERRKDFSQAAIETSLAHSLRRLNRDSVDIAFLHDPDGDWGLIAKEAVRALLQLREQGLIRCIGVGTTKPEVAHAVLDRLPVEVLLLAGRWTLLDRSGEAVIERCRNRGIQLVAGGIFNSGLLAVDQPSQGGPFDYAPAPAEKLARAAALQALCAAAGVSLKAAAAQFPRRHPGVTTTLLGPRTRQEIDELFDLLDLPIPPSLWPGLNPPGTPAGAGATSSGANVR